MNWDTYFTPQQRAMWSQVNVEAAKEYALREAVRDVGHLFELHHWFVLHGGGEASATPFTVRTVTELIHQDLMVLAVYENDGRFVQIEPSTADIAPLVEGLSNSGPTYLLSATEKGRAWVARYDALLRELSIPWEDLGPLA